MALPPLPPPLSCSRGEGEENDWERGDEEVAGAPPPLLPLLPPPPLKGGKEGAPPLGDERDWDG